MRRGSTSASNKDPEATNDRDSAVSTALVVLVESFFEMRKLPILDQI